MRTPLRVQRDESRLPPATAACLGAFDGVHLGHQALLDRARQQSNELAVVTFDPHPSRVVAPDRAPRLLYTPVQRARVLASLGVHTLVLLPFDRAMAAMQPDAFVRHYLVEGLHPAAVIVGRDFRFGAGRTGDVDRLAELLPAAGIGLDIVDPVPLPIPSVVHKKLGSTDIRRALDAGEVDRAGDMLGRWFGVTGKVVEGAKRGRQLGFPTANVDYGEGYLPPLGVYATALAVWDETSPDYGAVWPSVTNIGRNPTFTGPDAPVSLEVHVLDRALGERLYGVEVEVSFVARLRDEQKFDGPQALVRQLHDDVANARQRLTPSAMQRVLHPPPP